MFKRDLRESDTWCRLHNIAVLVMAGVMLMAAEASAARVSNSFVTIEGDGVIPDGNGGIIRSECGSGPVTVTARPGWLVNGRESVSYPSAKGLSGGLKFTSRLGEDHSCCPPPPTSNDVHCTDFVIGATANPPNVIALYAVPATSAVVTASASSKVVETGAHQVTLVWEEWECDVCGARQEARTEVSYYDVVPDTYAWTATAAGSVQRSSTWTGQMSKGVGQAISFDVVGTRAACGQCTGSAHAEASADVYELSVERPDYLGLDRTDAMKGELVTRTATAKIDPSPARATYSWTDCGRCAFVGQTSAEAVVYGATDETGGSESYLAEDLTVAATVRNADGLSASATCTTNFTVVAVDVTVGGVGEDKEETSPQRVMYSRELTKFAIGNLCPVRITCEPDDLPITELVWLTLSDNIELFETGGGGTPARARSFFRCNEAGGKSFGLLGRPPSGDIAEDFLSKFRDGSVVAEHYASGAKDIAKAKVAPPPPLEIAVNFISPSGKWPYDPVWDNPDYAKTLDGSQAKWCADNPGTAKVIYSLSRDAEDVDIGFYRSEAFSDSLIMVSGGVDSEGVHTNLLRLAEYLDEGTYYVKVEAGDVERGEKCDASDEGALIRDDYYTAQNVRSPMNCVEVGKVTVGESMYDKALRKLTVGLIVSGSAVVVAKAAAVFGLSAAVSSSAGAVAGTVMDWVLDLFTDIGDIPRWLESGVAICDCSWIASHWVWDKDLLTYVLATTHCVVGPGPVYSHVYIYGKFEIGYLAYAVEGDANVGTAANYLNEGFYCTEIETSEAGNKGYCLCEWKWEVKPYGLLQPAIDKPEHVGEGKE